MDVVHVLALDRIALRGSSRLHVSELAECRLVVPLIRGQSYFILGRLESHLHSVLALTEVLRVGQHHRSGSHAAVDLCLWLYKVAPWQELGRDQSVAFELVVLEQVAKLAAQFNRRTERRVSHRAYANLVFTHTVLRVVLKLCCRRWSRLWVKVDIVFDLTDQGLIYVLSSEK